MSVTGTPRVGTSTRPALPESGQGTEPVWILTACPGVDDHIVYSSFSDGWSWPPRFTGQPGEHACPVAARELRSLPLCRPLEGRSIFDVAGRRPCGPDACTGPLLSKFPQGSRCLRSFPGQPCPELRDPGRLAGCRQPRVLGHVASLRGVLRGERELGVTPRKGQETQNLAGGGGGPLAPTV